MPLLSCSAQNCVYNEDKYCSKGDILIQGDEAQTACETCCSSFKEAGEGSYKNSVGTPSATVQIDCTACNCHYNENNRCMAGRVDISGQSACTCNQTECSTFEKQ